MRLIVKTLLAVGILFSHWQAAAANQVDYVKTCQHYWEAVDVLYYEPEKLKDWQVQRNRCASVTDQSIMDTTFRAMIATLGDPYTDFFPRSLIEANQKAASNATTRIYHLGIWLKEVRQGELVISNLLNGFSAYDAGLKIGDRIISIDGVAAASLSKQDAEAKLAGANGAQIKVGYVDEAGTHGNVILTVKAPVREPASARIIQGASGTYLYIRMADFNLKAVKELEESILQATSALELSTLDGIVFDLRGNKGGYFKTAAFMAESFLDSGAPMFMLRARGAGKQVVSQTKSARPLAERHQETGRLKVVYDIFRTLPMVVLINGSAKSAPETFTVAMQSAKRAIVFGEVSYGKGVVYHEYLQPDGSVLKITTEEVRYADGRKIHEIGITPDVIVEQPRNAKEDVQLKAAVAHLDKTTK